MLAIDDLRFAYPRGGEELFGGLTLQFLPGAITAICGASGRGKSTLLYLLGLLVRPLSGRVLIDGADVSGLPDGTRSNLRSRHIGFVFQDAALDPGRTILDAVIEPALYAGLTAARVRPRALALLDGFGLAGLAAHRPGQISGGQAQRVALCRALLADPGIILADEPTGNLDADSSAVVLDALAAAARDGCTVLVATHAPGVVARARATVEL